VLLPEMCIEELGATHYDGAIQPAVQPTLSCSAK
jgi:hypothetical protein